VTAPAVVPDYVPSEPFEDDDDDEEGDDAL